ncbi:MAG: DUF4147 domain-containing protein [Planctomycetes bacterium]|nr:DUF4147 domain-containing protein [Planctomycetota bacterium]
MRAFDPHAFAREVLDALHPSRLLPRRLSVTRDAFRAGSVTIPLDGLRGVTVLGLGKAAVPQVEVVRGLVMAALGSILDVPRGFAITKRGHGASSAACEVLEAAHPLCDATSLAAGIALRRRVAATPADHLLVVCLSGGGSALAVEPRAPFALDDKIAVNRELLARGADIAATNLLRQEMSALKNGGLLRDVRARRLLTLVTVDVPSQDLALVASGPTAWHALDPGQIASAARTLLPAALAARFVASLEGSSRSAWQCELRDAAARADGALVGVGDWSELSRVAEATLRRHGVRGLAVLQEPLDQSVDAGVATHLAALRRAIALPRPTASISGGELCVAVRGSGRGGRNSEFVLRMAKALFHERRTSLDDAALDRALVLSLATDGSDGPTDAAGGFLTRALAGDGAAAGAELDDALARSDSLSYLERRGAAFRTGPSGTNLMDLRAIVLT